MVIDLRTELKKVDWSKAASWSNVADMLEGDMAGRCTRGELVAAGAESVKRELGVTNEVLSDMRAKTEADLVSALSQGRSSETAGRKDWSHAGLKTEGLRAALAELVAFPRVGEEGKRLAVVAKFMIELREVLLKCDASSAASWTGLAELLEGAEAKRLGGEWAEVAEAGAELMDMRSLTEERLVEALAQGRATKSTDAKFHSHETVSVKRLEEALAALQIFFKLPQGVSAVRDAPLTARASRSSNPPDELIDPFGSACRRAPSRVRFCDRSAPSV